MTRRVYIVIPVHDGIKHTLSLVRNLTPLMPPEGRIVIVDDGSTDDTTRILNAEHPEVAVLPGDGNQWWSGAINVGARYALNEGAEFILFLNNDIVLDPQFLEELVVASNEYPRALIASKILSADEPWRIWSMGGRFDWSKGKFWVLGHNVLDDGRWEEPLDVNWLPGMSVLVPTEVFRSGVWVDRQAFPQYSGDADFSIRARRAGFRLIVWPASRVYNKVRNSGLTSELLLRTTPFSFKKFIDSLTSIKSSAAFCTFARLIIRHAPPWAWPLTLGRFYGFYFLKCLQVWLRLPGIPKWRRAGRRDETVGHIKPLPRLPQEAMNDFN